MASAARVPTDWSKYAALPHGPGTEFLFFKPMERAYRRLLRHARFAGPVSILELGCGTATISRRLAGLLAATRVTLVDNNPAMLARARSTFAGSEAAVHIADESVLAFADGRSYSLVHSGGLVEHFPDAERERLMRIHAERTAPGGYCIVFVPTPLIAYRVLRRAREWLGLWLYTDEVPMPRRQLVAEVEAAGLTVVAVTYFWRWWLTEVGVLAIKR